MNKLLEKRSFQVFLAIAVLVVWAYNMLKIIDISSKENTMNAMDGIALNQSVLELPEKLNYTYKGNFRDPFKPQLTNLERNDIMNNAKKPEKSERPPRLMLTGIIEGTAMIRSGENKTLYFAAPGDEIEGARVVSVAEDSVIMMYRHESFVVNFN